MAIIINNHVVIDDNRGLVDVKNSPGLDKQIITSIGTATAWVSGAVIGDSLDLGYVGIATYTTPGTFTVGTNCPANISMIRIIGCGGGGNGGNGGTHHGGGSLPGAGGGGGGASRLGVKIVRVTNNQIFNITIGGAAGNTTITNPGPVPVVTFTGGNSGSNGSNSPSPSPPLVDAAGGAGGSNGTPIGAVDLFGRSDTAGQSIDASDGSPGFRFYTGPDSFDSRGGSGGRGAQNNKNYFYWDDIRIGNRGGGGDPGPVRGGSAATGRGAGGGGGAGGEALPPAFRPAGAGGAGSPGTIIIIY